MVNVEIEKLQKELQLLEDLKMNAYTDETKELSAIRIDQLKELIDLKTPGAPVRDEFDYSDFTCPKCKEHLEGFESECLNCGKVLDWDYHSPQRDPDAERV